MNTIAMGLENIMCAPLLAAADLSSQMAVWSLVLLVAGLALTPGLRASMTSVVAVILAAAAILIGLQISSPLTTGTILGAVGLLCVLPPSRTDLRIVGGCFFAVAIGYYGYALAMGHTTPTVEQFVEWVVFATLALATVGSSIAMVGSRSAVYSAIWFALALLATGGLFLYQGAQFLGVATVTVYAGAIVVTFLFVIMLAQPEGHSVYDRLSWGWFAKPTAALAAALLMGVVLFVLEGIEAGGLRERVAVAAAQVQAETADSETPFVLSDRQIVSARQDKQNVVHVRLTKSATPPSDAQLALLASYLGTDKAPVTVSLETPLPSRGDPNTEHHMAQLGSQLFSRQLLAVEVAGTLLLVSLVGVIVMLAQGAAAAREGDARV